MGRITPDQGKSKSIKVNQSQSKLIKANQGEKCFDQGLIGLDGGPHWRFLPILAAPEGIELKPGD
jgi:hypothetical protein